MGSFNTTCFVSQQSIAPNDKVVIFPVSQARGYADLSLTIKGVELSVNDYAYSTCHPNAYWGFCGPLLTGTYNDYGAFLLDNNPTNIRMVKLFFDSVRDNAAQTAKGRNQYHENSFNPAEWYSRIDFSKISTIEEGWAELEALVDSRRVYLNIGNKIRPLAFSVMHKAAADELIRVGESDDTTFSASQTRKELVLSAIESCPVGLPSAYWVLAMGDCGIGEYESLSLKSLYRSINNKYSKELEESILKYGITSPESWPLLMDEVRPNLDHRYISRGLELMEVHIEPMTTSGQDYDNDAGKKFFKLVQTVRKSLKEEAKKSYRP
jgi:hypothetical protein